jgi:hypothetical protein
MLDSKKIEKIYYHTHVVENKIRKILNMPQVKHEPSDCEPTDAEYREDVSNNDFLYEVMEMSKMFAMMSLN